MAKSILQNEKVCYLCGSHNMLESHHVYNGNPNRTLSEKYGLKVYLCHSCHNEPPNGVHFNSLANILLKAHVQKKGYGILRLGR